MDRWRRELLPLKITDRRGWIQVWTTGQRDWGGYNEKGAGSTNRSSPCLEFSNPYAFEVHSTSAVPAGGQTATGCAQKAWASSSPAPETRQQSAMLKTGQRIR